MKLIHRLKYDQVAEDKFVFQQQEREMQEQQK
jgi:hypothetical protein